MNGPKTSANGGVACGTVAAFVDGPAEARLHRVVPLDTPLEVVTDGHVELRAGGEVVASARPCAEIDLQPPLRPTVAEGREAVARRMPRAGSVEFFADCWVCSDHRSDGLGALFGRSAADPLVNAGVIVPGDPSAWDGDGVMTELALWGALDCPSYAPVLWDRPKASLLAQLAIRVDRKPVRSDELVCVGWHLRSDGRKHHTASAVLTGEGELCGVGRALWIELR